MRGHGGGSAPEAPWGPGAEWLAPPTRLPWAESGCQAVLSRCRAAWALGRDAAQEGIKVDGLRVGCRPDPARSAVGAHQGAAVDGAPGVAVPGFPGPGLPSYWKPAHCPSACLWGPWPGGPRSMPHPSGRPGPPLPLPLCPQEESHQLSRAQRCILLRVWAQDLPSILTQAFTSLLAFPPPQDTCPCLLPTTSPTWRNKVRCGEGFWASQPQWGSRTPPARRPGLPSALLCDKRKHHTHVAPSEPFSPPVGPLQPPRPFVPLQTQPLACVWSKPGSVPCCRGISASPLRTSFLGKMGGGLVGLWPSEAWAELGHRVPGPPWGPGVREDARG